MLASDGAEYSTVPILTYQTKKIKNIAKEEHLSNHEESSDTEPYAGFQLTASFGNCAINIASSLKRVARLKFGCEV